MPLRYLEEVVTLGLDVDKCTMLSFQPTRFLIYQKTFHQKMLLRGLGKPGILDKHLLIT
jgi:hypothetical protein